MHTREDWLNAIGNPQNYEFPKTRTLIKRYDFPDYSIEVYRQANGIRTNGEITYQRLFMGFPKNASGSLPGVAVPFYYPEATLGFDPETSSSLPRFAENPTFFDLLRRGFVVATAESYHLTYMESPLAREDFSRWRVAAEALLSDHPGWTGMGKLIADTRLVLDALEEDSRVDANRLGIAGHSLGGKMAFYTGCLDDRVKVILASDFGIGWEQTNWNDIWYWGEKLTVLKAQGFDHSSLLACAAPKPFCLLAGLYDNDDSRQMMDSVSQYRELPGRLFFVNHATGHRPPKYAADAGYGFLAHWLEHTF